MDNKFVLSVGGAFVAGLLVSVLILPFMLKGMLTDVAKEAAREVAVQVSADAKPLVEQAIIDVRADVKAEIVRARAPIAATNAKAQDLMGAGIDLMRKKLKDDAAANK
jgi:hypothetical protein